MVEPRFDSKSVGDDNCTIELASVFEQTTLYCAPHTMMWRRGTRVRA